MTRFRTRFRLLSRFVPPQRSPREPEIRFGARVPKSLHVELSRIAKAEGYDLESVVDHFLWCAEERLKEWLPEQEEDVRLGGRIRKSVFAKIKAEARAKKYTVNRAMETCLSRAVLEYQNEKQAETKASRR